VSVSGNAPPVVEMRQKSRPRRSRARQRELQESRERREGRVGGVLLVAGGLLLAAVGGVQAVAALEIVVSRSKLESFPVADLKAADHPADNAGTIVPTAPWAADAEELIQLARDKAWLATQVSAKDQAFAEALFASATDDSRRAVESSPGNSDGWLTLADLKRAAGEPPGETAQLLTAAILTAPFEPAALMSRLAIGFSAYGGLDDHGRELLAAQIRMAWRHAPAQLVKLALQPDRVNGLFLVRLALANDPLDLAKFEGSLGSLR
jgi:hypothetical protein